MCNKCKVAISDNSHYVRYSVQPTYISDVQNSSSDLDDVIDTYYKRTVVILMTFRVTLMIAEDRILNRDKK